MKNTVRLFPQLFALLLLLLQTPLCVSAQKSKTPVTSPDLQFASGQSARRIPFEFVGNHIYLRARVNDSEPLWFLLDSGASASYFGVQQAKALGLGVQGQSLKVAVSLPGVRLLNQNFSIASFGFSGYDGHAIDGMLGYDFINRFVIEIDYVNRTVNLYDPKDYKYSGLGDIIPLIMLEDDSGGKVPLVRTKIMQLGRAQIEGKFIADLAVRAAITFNTRFVEANKLLQTPQKTIQAVLGAGAMVRESKQPIGRLPNILLGRFTIQNPVAIFFQDKQGVMASPEFDGVLGSEILRRFKVIFDYSRQQMILEPNRYFSEAYEHDMTGMLLVTEGTGFRVKAVMEDSPATAAGLQEGDVISAINGKPASALKLEQLRVMFMRERRSYRLTINRSKQRIQTIIKLRRLI
ncbi:MAG: aspartyl protease family protein [Pyrinomonadaceae bacterium]